jgi:hypothetical protein
MSYFENIYLGEDAFRLSVNENPVLQELIKNRVKYAKRRKLQLRKTVRKAERLIPLSMLTVSDYWNLFA